MITFSSDQRIGVGNRKEVVGDLFFIFFFAVVIDASDVRKRTG